MSELINIKEQDGGFSFGKVYVHKYSKKSFYKGLWDDENVNDRGHIYDEEETLIVNPFKKTFNWCVDTNEMVSYNLKELVEDLGSIPINSRLWKHTCPTICGRSAEEVLPYLEQSW